MIVQWFVQALCALFSDVLSLLPSWSAPSFLADIASGITTIGSFTASTSAWIPWGAMAIGIPVLVACSTAALAIKGVRMLLSLTTGGGGSSA